HALHLVDPCAVPLHARAHYRVLHSFPTRRSSDLVAQVGRGRKVGDHARERDLAAVDVAAEAQRTLDGVLDHGTRDAHGPGRIFTDRKSTRLNSSHRTISYAVFCLKKKTNDVWRTG